MRDEDHLFVRCLMVVLTVVGGLMSLLLLAPPTEDRWGTGLPGSNPPAASEVGSMRWIRPVFSLPSAGAKPAHSRAQTGTKAHTFGELLAQAQEQALTTTTTATKGHGRWDGARSPPRRAAVMTLDLAAAPASTSATRDLWETQGGDAAQPSLGRSPPTPPELALVLPAPLEVMPQLWEMAAMDIVVQRHPDLTPRRAGLQSQGMGDDPLPEFRRFLPRAQACVMQAARRMGEPVVGKLVLEFTVERNGWVTGAHSAGGSLTDVDARACILTTLGGERFFEERAAPVTAQRAVIVR